MKTRITVAGTEIGVFNDDGVGMGLAMRLEDETGWTVPELLQQVGRGSARALQALVWFTQVQSGHPTPNRHMEFTFQDLVLEPLDEPEQETESAGKDAGPGKPKAVRAA